MGQRSGTVIIADDSKLNREFLKAVVQQQGYEVLEAANGKEVLDIVNSYNGIDMIFMDCSMPIMSGFEVTLKIRNLAQDKSKIKIIGVSAYATESECHLAGMDGYFPKPVNITGIRTLLKKSKAV